MSYLEAIVRAFRPKPRQEGPFEETVAITDNPKDGIICLHPLQTTKMDHWRVPMEIWWDILQFAVEPSFATDQEFLPQNVQFYFSAIII